MSKTIEYDFQTPKYTSPAGKFIKLDTVNNQIEINDPTVPKQILINTTEISNGVQNINFVNLYEKLDAIQATVYPHPDSTTVQINERVLLDGGVGYTNSVGSQEIKLNDPVVSEAHLSAYNIIHTNTSTGDYFSNNSDTMQVNNVSNPSYINMSPYNGLSIQNDVKGGSPTSLSQLTHSQLQIFDPTGSIKTSLSPGDITIIDSGNVYTSNLTTDYLTFQNTTTSQSTIIGQSALTLVNRDYYLGASSLSMMKLGTIGFGYNITNAYTAYVILKTDNFVFCDVGVGFVRFDSPGTYYDDTGARGYTVMISNIDGSDVSIDLGGALGCAHFSGVGGGSYALKKYATASFTLVYSPNYSSDVWMITEYN